MSRSPLIRHLEYRMNVQKMSNFIIETGDKGSGKSWLACKFGEVLQKDFSIENVCFSTETLFQKLDEGFYKPGDVAVVEELGILANSRNAMSRINKKLSFIAQAIRPARITLISNTITWGLIDIQVKNMADYKLSVLGYDKQTMLNEFKFMKIKPTDTRAEPFMEHLQFHGAKHTSWVMGAPSEELREIYDIERNKFLKALYSTKEVEKKDKRKGVDVPAEATAVLSKIEEYRGIKGGVSVALIEAKRDVGTNKARAIAAVVNEMARARGIPIN